MRWCGVIHCGDAWRSAAMRGGNVSLTGAAASVDRRMPVSARTRQGISRTVSPPWP